jgi:hypothetical protein
MKRHILRERVEAIITEAGGLRAAARVCGIGPEYLCRLRTGKKSNPRDSVLKKLGLKRVVFYERLA